MMVMFLAGALLTGLLLLSRGQSPRPAELRFGAGLGLPNFGSGAFLVLALQQMRGTIAFPAVNAGTLFLLVLAGLLFWRERAGRSGLAGLALTVVALVLIKGAELIREILEVSP
jgi:drug/metabolite transporter (DMT)-like permease